MTGCFPSLPAPSGSHSQPQRIVPAFLLLLIVLLGVVGSICFSFSCNPYTPAGYVGYLTRGAILGRAEFIDLQSGPTSPDRRWLLDIINVSVTIYTYIEDFAGGNTVLAKHNLKTAL